MKRFKFKFQTVLDARKASEQEALRMLAVAQKAYQLEIDRKNFWISELQKALQGRESAAQHPTEISFYKIQQDYVVGSKQRIIQADHAISRASRGVEKALRAYLHARRQTKMMETLSEKDFLQFKKDLAKKEQKDLDDLMIMRAHLKEEFFT